MLLISSYNGSAKLINAIYTGMSMFKNKVCNKRNNICGEKIKILRKQMNPKTSQRIFAEKLQIAGLDLDKNAIQRIESGQRFVTDIELKAIAQILNVSCDELLDCNENE